MEYLDESYSNVYDIMTVCCVYIMLWGCLA